MLKKLHISLIFSALVVSNPLSTIIVDMRNFVIKFGKIFEICKKFAGNQVNEKGMSPADKKLLRNCCENGVEIGDRKKNESDEESKKVINNRWWCRHKLVTLHDDFNYTTHRILDDV